MTSFPSDRDRDVIRKDTPLDPTHGRPHVFVLGAGASHAALPHGDKYGRHLPLMRNLIEVVGLQSVIDQTGVDCHSEDFEAVFAKLSSSPGTQKHARKIERAVFDYFASLQLPDEPTIYDHLVLSLREKDLIATFNWDPFLIQAMLRNSERVKQRPQVVFLHGNTAIGHCVQHKPYTLGVRGRLCRKCYRPLRNSKLLYPIEQKNYSRSRFLSASWRELRNYLKSAFVLTIFGYSAPVSDVEAIRLMTEAWGDPVDRELEEIEIIDIKGDEELRRTWRPFIHSHHYQTTKSFYESIVSQRPRRSVELMWSNLMEITPVEENPIPRNADWDELYRWLEPLLAVENKSQQ